MHAYRSVILAACLGCSHASGRPSLAEPKPSSGGATPKAARAASLVPVPESSPCTIRGQVTRRDVVWKLRTRLDAIPTMEVEEARVTAFLRPGARRHHPNAFVEVENSSMLIRAYVASEDLKVVLAKTYESLPGHYPDGTTHRPVLEVEGNKAWVAIDMEGATGTVSVLDCNLLALAPAELGTERSLPEARGEVVVKKGASVKTANGYYGVDALWRPYGVTSPEGIVAELRGDDVDPLARLISIKTCGGVIVGHVPKSHLLGPPKVLHGSNAGCPNAGARVFVERNPLERPLTCPREISVFLRSETLEDPVGILRAGAKLQVVGEEVGGTVLIRVEPPPAVPLEGFSFSVRARDLEGCAPV